MSPVDITFGFGGLLTAATYGILSVAGGIMLSSLLVKSTRRFLLVFHDLDPVMTLVIFSSVL